MSALLGYNTNVNGLSLYLDARNPTSYPGSGTTWFDLSPNAANVSTGSMTYVSAGLTSSFSSSFVTGINTSSIDFYAPNLTSPFITVETVCRFNNQITFQSTVFSWNLYYVAFNNNRDLFFADNSGGDTKTTLSSPLLGVWRYFVFIMCNGTTGPLNMSNNNMYVNNIRQNLISSGLSNLANQNFNGGNGSISKIKGRNPVDGNYNGTNDYAMFKVYNRSLSEAEITNNYNYYKPIFNLT
jgi:hypothetical protein